MPHSSRAIANEFLKRAQQEGRALTNMQLQKLPYIAHGWSLALRDAPLIHERPEAWPYGPVYRDLYNSLKRYGPNAVTDYIHDHDDNPAAYYNRGNKVEEFLQPDEISLIDAVWENYKGFGAYELSNMTHRDGTPWTDIHNKHRAYSPIPDDIIQAHYKTLMRERTGR